MHYEVCLHGCTLVLMMLRFMEAQSCPIYHLIQIKALGHMWNTPPRLVFIISNEFPRSNEIYIPSSFLFSFFFIPVNVDRNRVIHVDNWKYQDLGFVINLDMYLIIIQNFEYPYYSLQKSMWLKLNDFFLSHYIMFKEFREY